MNKRSDLISIFILVLVFIGLYYPVWIADYIYTDEVVQLWYYGKQPGFQMFLPQGRYVTEKLMLWLFGSVQHIEQVKYVRGFSFIGWLLAIPVWYYILKAVVKQEGFPVILAFFCTLYLICIPPFTISVLWSSCLELFLANTAGLVSGYCLYRAIRTTDNRVQVSSKLLWLSVISGVIALFTYQNGMGCFFIPFIIHLLSAKRNFRHIWISIGVYLFIAVVYYLLFKYNLKSAGIVASERTSLHIDPWGKLKFFLTRSMGNAFNFTWLFNEKKYTGYILYLLVSGGWVLNYWWRNRRKPLKEVIASLVILFLILLLIYLPSLPIRENYASNRTLLALKMAVFVMVAESILFYAREKRTQSIIVTILAVFFVTNAWYNSRNLFLKPVQYEYGRLSAAVTQAYDAGARGYYFIRPPEDLFVQQFGITRSWDEFGVPSSFFDWVPEVFVKQVLFEKTNNRTLADKIVVKHWRSMQEWQASGEQLPSGYQFIDAEKIIRAGP